MLLGRVEHWPGGLLRVPQRTPTVSAAATASHRHSFPLTRRFPIARLGFVRLKRHACSFPFTRRFPIARRGFVRLKRHACSFPLTRRFPIARLGPVYSIIIVSYHQLLEPDEYGFSLGLARGLLLHIGRAVRLDGM
jgi:hypothetical protein